MAAVKPRRERPTATWGLEKDRSELVGKLHACSARLSMSGGVGVGWLGCTDSCTAAYPTSGVNGLERHRVPTFIDDRSRPLVPIWELV